MFQENTPSNTLIGLMRESNWTMRSIASVVILTFGGLVTSPAVAAVKQEIKEIQWHKADASNAAKLSAKVEETHAFLTKLAAHDAKTLDLAASHEQLRALKADLESLDKGTMDDFAANEAHIKAHKLPEVIEQRQQDAVKTYRSRMDTLMAELKAADAAKDAAGFMTHVAAAKAHLDKVQVKPFHEKFDPKNLPFSVAKPTGVKPRLTKKDYEARPVAPKKRAQVAANGSLAGIITAADVTGALPVSPSDPSYVATTDDVQITPAIQAQAKALNNDPVQIYNWVHNNVEYVPTYGSIQGSDMTLQTLKGNDFDQASLLISLLRASNIPARYVYGTIQVPIAQVENWVGGVTDPNAALNLMSQGNIPATGLVQGGQVKYAQFEHVWVEAWINYIPSRGAKSGSGNTWAPMDASFKQYTYAQGINLASVVPFDATTVAQQAMSTATLNSSLGAISNVNQTAIQDGLSSYETQLNTYISSLDPTTPFSKILGAKTILSRTSPSLSASTPYQVLAVAQRMAALDSSLRYQFQYQLDDQNDNQILSYTASTPDLAGNLLALSFAPASSADEDLIESYLPSANPDGSPLTLSDFPAALPGYAINVIPQLVLNGQVIASGGPMPLGTALQSHMGYKDLQQGWIMTTGNVIAGEYHAIGLDLQGISSSEMMNLQARMQNTSSALSSDDTSTFTSHLLVGDKLQATILSYFLENDLENQVAGRQAGAIIYAKPSYGEFSNIVSPNYTYGIPLSVNYPGYVMDIKHAENAEAAIDNDQQKLLHFNQIIGIRYSTLEGLAPEQMVNTSATSDSGVSTVTALATAATQGQQIYQITSQNMAAVLPLLNQSSDVIENIQSAVNAGLQVTISQSTVTLDGWTGVGYIAADPQTGLGGYEITGGASGGIADVLAAISDAFCSIMDHYSNGPQKTAIGKIEDTDLGAFGRAITFIGCLLSFKAAFDEGCGVGQSAFIAFAEWDFSFLLSELLFALIPLLTTVFIFALPLIIAGLYAISKAMDYLTQLAGTTLCAGPGHE